MNRRMTPTLALVIAGGLAAGIALARPATTPVAAAQPEAATVATAPTRGFLSGDNESAAIKIADFAFGAAPTAAPGQAVTATNRDGVAHTVTADSGAFDTSSIPGGAEATFVAPTASGTYTFFCAIHPSMQGELIVQG